MAIVLNKTKVKRIFCSAVAAKKLSEIDSDVKSVVCFDDVPVKTINELKEKGILCYSFYDMLKRPGRRILDCPHIKPSDCLAITCTIGTTGPVKLCAFSHLNVLSGVAIMKKTQDNLLKATRDVNMVYHIISHIYLKVSSYTQL